MSTSTYLKSTSFICALLFYTGIANGELCFCPKKPVGTECNNECKGKTGGAVWLDRPPPHGTGPVAPTFPAPAAHEKLDVTGQGKESEIMKPEKSFKFESK
ncbi:hypothetical protein J1G35_15165 [Pseudomonas sp. SH10-3B]|uniref:hypothetical protein n=1 Tax=Pseudomonas sp. SH10-3B TaxID=2816049 RepID=UPI001CA7A93A|nr:hypothetical protein [Pseudomonas sp. SH10-3B]MBY8947200.1 hypothetical protein [Pseudomonas sp. SH10-3B]